MKKIILTAIASIAFLNVAKAQSSDVTYGLKAGFNLTTLYTNDEVKDDFLLGFNAGGYLNLPISSAISIQPELTYSSKGAQLVYDSSILKGTARFRLNYIEVPVLLKLNILPFLNIHAGPYAAYLINGKASNKSNAEFLNFEEELSNKNFTKIDYGFAGGVGIDLNATSIGLRYTHGLQGIGEKNSVFSNSKNSAISLYATFKL